MKKILFTVFIAFSCILSTNAKEITVELKKCVDGDTAKFTYNEKVITARFLAINTPESVSPKKGVEAFGKEASDYTCNKLKKAKEIILEYDKNSDKKDKYDRELVWVFIDGNLLQKDLLKEGLAKVEYLYGDYKYTDELKKVEKEAKKDKIGVWSNEKESKSILEDYKEIIMLLGIIILIVFFNYKPNKSDRKKIIKTIKKKVIK